MLILSDMDWKPWIFAAKTTAAGLIALLIAFTFNLDQPQWTLLTVFIVSQPRADGAVLGKSFYRIIGTFIGAAIALLLVALFAQERVLFLGGIALWVGICTLGSQYARSWAAYSFVLSGYTAIIVGIPGALDAGNAFYIAMARVTEVCLGIIVSATVAHVIFPDPVTISLDTALADGRRRLVSYAISVLTADRYRDVQVEVLKDASTTESLLRSAIFEDRRIRETSGLIRAVAGASVDVLASGQSLERQGELMRRRGWSDSAGLVLQANQAIGLLKDWQAGQINAAALAKRLGDASTDRLPSPAPRQIAVERRGGLLSRQAPEDQLREFFAALSNYTIAYEALKLGGPGPRLRILLANPGDFLSAFFTGLRASLAVTLAGCFWILADWPHGSTATILTAVATARVATMGHAVLLSIATALIFSLSAFPAFFVVETLLPLTSGFPGFALAVGSMLFLFAFLMAFERTMIIGYMSALLFASVGSFQDLMAYDPIGLVNTTIAAVLAVCLTFVLWAIIAPDTPRSRRCRFARAAHRAMAPILTLSGDISLVDFEEAMGGALAQLAAGLQPDRAEDRACLDVGITLLGAGRQLLLPRHDWQLSLSTVPRQRTIAAKRHVLRDWEVAVSSGLSAMRRDAPNLQDLEGAVQGLVALQEKLTHRALTPASRTEEMQD